MSQITREQRYAFSALLKAGHSVEEAAKAIGKPRSTMYAEVKRNTNEKTGKYTFTYAQMCADVRKERMKMPRKMLPELVDFICERLREGWSPEQIEGYRRRHGLVTVPFKWIYVFIRHDKEAGGDLWKFCRHKLKNRSRPVGQCSHIKDRVSIDQRPPMADALHFGHWEMDTIVGPDNKGAVLTLTERNTRFAILVRLPKGKSPGDLALQAKLALLPYKKAVLTITTDNGLEFAAHKEISSFLNAPIYFTHPYSSWEKGAIENANKLIRQYIPKKARLEQLTGQQLFDIQKRLNSRPRKCLNYDTPFNRFRKALNSVQV